MLVLTLLLLSYGSFGQNVAPAPNAKHDIPKAARAAFDKAMVAVKGQKIDEARADCERAVQLDPGFTEAWYELGQLQRAQKQVDAGRKSFETAIRADPT
jgi:Tfp pilus assembly protein PilF